MNQSIKTIAKQVIDEATAIIQYTCSIEEAGDDKEAVARFTEIRGDELNHLTQLVVLLSSRFKKKDE
jgi:hypothetical protein